MARCGKAVVVIPDFQSLMRPVLAIHQDGQPHTAAELRDKVAAEVGVTEEDRRVMLPSEGAAPGRAGSGQDELSPREAIAEVIDSAHSAVAADLLTRVVKQPPEFLERLVLQLLGRMGYGGLETPTEHLGRAGDAGLDGLIRLDKLGLDVVYVQAKRYTDRHVGRPDIQAFVGALHGAQASRGVFITTSRFSSDARDYAERVNARLVLIDGPELAALMIEHDCGVITEESFVLKQVDENFFEEP